MSFSKKITEQKKRTENFASKVKKYPKANLENYSKLFVQLGLVLSLTIVYLLIQSKTFTNNLVVFEKDPVFNSTDLPPNIEYKVEPPKQILPQKKVELAVLKKTDDLDDVPDFVIKDMDPDKPVNISEISNVKIEEALNPKDEIFDIIGLEVAPLFPGCKGTNEERKACFSEQVRKFVNRKFNKNLAGELGLTPGIQKIFTLFIIDKNGNVIDIQARAPHKGLQAEAIRVINLLPKIEPGKQHGNAVKVRYSMPIIFRVE